MDKLVGFVKKKQLDAKFKKAGEGHRLDEEKKPPRMPQVAQQEPRRPPSTASRTAGTAALQRIENGERNTNTTAKPKLGVSNTSSVSRTEKEQMYFTGAGHHLERQRSDPSYSSGNPPAVSRQSSDPREGHDCKQVDNNNRAVGQSATPSNSPFMIKVMLICPVCRQSIPQTTIKSHLSQCLHEEYLKEPFSASIQMIYTLAENEERRKSCVDTLTKYVGNIVSNPLEEKYRKIRVNNKAFRERVESVTGGILFLEALGFTKQTLMHQDAEEEFYVLPEDRAQCTDELAAWREMLSMGEKLHPQLDRSPQLLVPSGNVEHFNLPDEFYNLSVDEIRKEQKAKSDAVEQASMLRTKAMRERDELKAAVRYYKFVLLRIRFPEDIILQGVFRPVETLSSVRQFISSCLLDPSREYKLVFLKTPLNDSDLRLAQIGLAPAALLTLLWDGGEDLFGFPIEQIFKPAIYQTLSQ